MLECVGCVGPVMLLAPWLMVLQPRVAHTDRLMLLAELRGQMFCWELQSSQYPVGKFVGRGSLRDV